MKAFTLIQGSRYELIRPLWPSRNWCHCLLWSSLWALSTLKSLQSKIQRSPKINISESGPNLHLQIVITLIFWHPPNLISSKKCCEYVALKVYWTNKFLGWHFPFETNLHWMLQMRPEADQWLLLQYVSVWAYACMWHDLLYLELFLPPTISSSPSHKKTFYYQVSISVM